jgi:hypothetical protein
MQIPVLCEACRMLTAGFLQSTVNVSNVEITTAGVECTCEVPEFSSYRLQEPLLLKSMVGFNKPELSVFCGVENIARQLQCSLLEPNLSYVT